MNPENFPVYIRLRPCHTKRIMRILIEKNSNLLPTLGITELSFHQERMVRTCVELLSKKNKHYYFQKKIPVPYIFYSYLSAKEQKILDQNTIFVSSNSIPDDLINEIPINQLIQSQVITSVDKTNSCIIRDGSFDSVTFQQNIKSHAHEHAKKNGRKEKILLGERRIVGVVQEVPNFTTLKKQVESFMVRWKPTLVEKYSDSWNLMFHQILTECDIRSHYSASNLPECYHPGNSCGHILHVELEEAAGNTLRLTILEFVKNKSSAFSLQVASSFIHAFVFHNPVWDIGFQFEMAKTQKLFHLKKESYQNYSSTCLCPCSSIFANWHEKNHILTLPNFK